MLKQFENVEDVISGCILLWKIWVDSHVNQWKHHMTKDILCQCRSVPWIEMMNNIQCQSMNILNVQCAVTVGFNVDTNGCKVESFCLDLSLSRELSLNFLSFS